MNTSREAELLPVIQADRDAAAKLTGEEAMAYGMADLSDAVQAFAQHRGEALEEAAKVAANGCLVPPDGGEPTEAEIELCDGIAAAIRALKSGKALTTRIGGSGLEGEVGRVPSAPGCEPTASAAQEGVFAKSHPSRKWLARFAAVQTDGAVEAAAKSIAPLILENFDGVPYGSVKWETEAASDKDIIRVIARRAMHALTSYAHVHACDSDRSGEAVEPPFGGSTEGESAGPKGIAP